MNRSKYIRWLYDELPGLVGSGIVDNASAERLRGHYGPVTQRRAGSLALLIFGVIGAGLIGLGILLILAHNWDGMSRPMRAGLGFGLLVAAQAIAAFAFLKRPPSRALSEGSALFLGLCIGATIALIGQTYNIPGDLGAFILTWMLLAFPLMYLLDSGAVAVGYLSGITAWSWHAQDQSEHALWFWPLAALVAPYIVWAVRNDRYALRTSWILSGTGVSAIAATGVVLDRSLPGLWIPIYSGLFSVMYLGGAFLFHEAEGIRQKPLYGIGALGLVLMSLVFTFEEPWGSIGWHYYREGDGYFGYAAIADYALAAVLLTGATVLLVTAVRRGHAEYIPLGAMPMVATIAYAIGSDPNYDFVPYILFNVYVFAVSIFTIARGVRTERLEIVNSGMLIFSTLVAMRFFDSDLSFVARGAAFIAIGIGFLATNMVLIARKRTKA